MTKQQLMRSIRVHEYGGPENLKLEQVQRPEPSEGEVLVRIVAAGVLPIDWKIRQGIIKFPISFPYTPGTAFSGVIEELGSGVSGFEVGQRIYGRSTNGTYAEYTTASVESIAVLADTISFEEGAALFGGATTAWQALVKEVELKSGDRVLVHGAAGGVGLFAVQFAKRKGAYVIGTCGTDNVEFVRSLGADEIIDYKTTSFDQEVRDVDVLFDTIGGETLERSWPLVKQGGTLITIVGMPNPEKAKELGIHAIRPTNLASGEDLVEIASLMESGKVKASLADSYPLEQASQAHERSQTGHGRGRILLAIASD
ncbi:NADP-dependent oxidoreductase [Cohnella lupini]|uniref:NADPH:quinone reductase-like Zn-dependent oxidoreductase n=1 Tax=Cohnella lupini TaxID=1294267 RepID=A0A3D9IX82_9BACL|nr:NADP-dependent oxidoreductase [Cohnella lupini]RED66217.1 NADPH:quinone reductase-like Zn-dependent oxidoreductase [Cohnella lupini]